jgi:uncharacterized protein (DUF1330 family)
MSKGYWVAFADVTDPEGYKAYLTENRAIFREYGARYLTRGGQGENPEGQPRSRVVVLEFPTFDAAIKCYHSPEYAKAMELRAGKSIMDLAIVPGYEGQQPDETT